MLRHIVAALSVCALLLTWCLPLPYFIIRLISLSGKSSIGGKANPQIASTEDAAALAGMDWDEGIGTAEPLVLDNALDAVTARHKGIDSPVSNSSSTV